MEIVDWQASLSAFLIAELNLAFHYLGCTEDFSDPKQASGIVPSANKQSHHAKPGLIAAVRRANSGMQHLNSIERESIKAHRFKKRSWVIAHSSQSK
jgi:hypothetical protein